ncbi:MAG: NADH-quinone oxidoreductase subunit A [Deltaproteobacteria bacterium]|nr:NADH-quinone oxidoreductase subunit A [Deltaproteobacteria bacterium]MBI3295466.1 NADH-quinone oxidoreductase subunit A [Deltaproteobacteria bacterium]
MENYIPVLLLLGFAIIVASSILVLSWWLGPKKPLAVKLSAYECGVNAEGSPHAPFASKFYLVAVMFLLVDVEAAFFFPWALVYKESLQLGPILFVALVIYVAIFALGLFYIIKKDCLRLR